MSGESVVQSRVWVVCYLNPALSERAATGSLASADGRDGGKGQKT
jgi:hypothetical protein